MVQRTKAGGISQMGRPTQGVKVMNMKEDDVVSAVALVVDDGTSTETEVVEVTEPMDVDPAPAAPEDEAEG
jgi:DNA gyrase subunit A